MLQKYALIQNSKIVKIRDVDSDDTILIPKLTANNYYPVVETVPPLHDLITQTLESSYDIQVANKKVMRVWKVVERPFADAAVAKKYDIEIRAVSSIQSFFDAADQSMKVTACLSVKDTMVTSVKLAKNNIELRAIKPVFPTATVKVMEMGKVI